MQGVSNVAGKPCIDPPGPGQRRQTGLSARQCDPVFQRQCARAMDQRKYPQLFQVDLGRLGSAQTGQTPPPAALCTAVKLPDRQGKTGIKAVAPGQDPPQPVAQGGKQPLVPGNRGGVKKDCQMHRPLGVRAMDPVADTVTKVLYALAPQRTA